MSLAAAVLLGLVQGLTEFLPVSSSGHLVIGQHLLGVTENTLEFDVIVHVGTLLSVFVFFRRDLLAIWRDSLAAIADAEGRRKLLRFEGAPGARMAALIVLGTIPTGVIGLTFEKQFEALFGNLKGVGAFLLLTSLLLFVSWWKAREPVSAEAAGEGAGTLTPARSFWIGVGQGCAVAPGLSRAGTTISAALLLGVERETAGRFSFLLSIPAILGATLLRARHFGEIPAADWPAYGAGFVVAMLSGLAALALLMRVVRRGALHFFGFYTAVVGALALWLG